MKIRCSTLKFASLVTIGVLISWGGQFASASLITNGTFDTDLSGWDTTGTTTGVTWVSGTAHVGRPGTPGLAFLAQSFDIPLNALALDISFEYQWQVEQPDDEDFFLVELEYESGSGTVVETLLDEGSDSAAFNSTVAYSVSVPLSDLKNVADNGTIRFALTENNFDRGTRIQLDNVSVNPVPEPATFVIWSLLGGLGLTLGWWRRKRAA